jgi:NAD(P)-dependent dehydrogenase (short-subunit alcohol dehydrogenase family)
MALQKQLYKVLPLPSYQAAEHPVEPILAFTETIATEVAGLGVRALLVAPGAFRTEGIYGSQWSTENNIPAYDSLRDAATKRFHSICGTEKGDPAKAMELLVDVVRGEGKAAGRPFPRYLILGEDAHGDAIRRAQQVTSAVEEWKDITGKAVEFD